jgi:hypothetical protein
MLLMSQTNSRHMRHLFDAELRYEDGMAPVIEVTTAGTSSAAVRAAWKAQASVARCAGRTSSRCLPIRLNVVAGMIETDDGPEIQFDSQGFALPPTEAGAWKGGFGGALCCRRLALPLA